MDVRQLLDQLFSAGQKMAEQGIERSSSLLGQGKEIAAQGLQYAGDRLPPPGAERDQLLKALGVGAAAGGILTLLVGTQSGRRAIAPIAKLGSVAALGGLAYKLYTEWQKSQGSQAKAVAIDQLDGESANHRSMNLVRAMIAAAKADGSIDDDENSLITQQLNASELDDTTSAMLMSELQQPIDAQRIAENVACNEEAVEVYLASLVVTGAQTPAERNYLNELATALRIDAALARQLEKEVIPSSET